MSLEYLSAVELGTLVNKRELKPLEVLEFFENRIQERNKRTNAFVYTKFEDAKKEALRLEKELMEGKYLGPFAGVPFGLKDFLPNKPGWQSSHGGVECLISTDTCYSEFCKAMEKAGGIAVGKTNAPAYGFRGVTDNRLYGPTSTPFNIKYNSGGSSGGSAAAVADGLVPIAEGGDAGGSIRIPANWCNLFGYKPGLGTVPSVIRPDAWSATHPFCFNFGLTRNVEDAAVLLDYMAYYDPRDPYSSTQCTGGEFQRTVLNTDTSFLTGKRVALTLDFDLFEVEEEIRNMIKTTVEGLEKEGCIVDLIPFNFKYNAEQMSDSWCQSLIFDSVIEIEEDKRNGRDYIKEHPEQFPEEIQYWIEKCKNSTIQDLYNFNLIRTDILDNFRDKLDTYDFIISPVSCCHPALNASDRNTKGPASINGKEIDPLIGWSLTYLVNFIGYPAASVPIGLSKDGFPVGMHVIGDKFKDMDVLRFSRAFELLHPWETNFKLIGE